MRLSSLLLSAILLVGLGACDTAVEAPSSNALTPEAPITAEVPATADVRGHPDQGRALAVARRASAPYQRVQAALDDGYLPTEDCVEVEGLGGMGYHYGNPALLFDGGALDPAAPEVVLYEPQANGRLRLVAVEYVVDYADSPTPPELFGQEFHPGPIGWALHVWLWKHNPTGIFEDFNPRVSCDHVTDEG